MNTQNSSNLLLYRVDHKFLFMDMYNAYLNGVADNVKNYKNNRP